MLVTQQEYQKSNAVSFQIHLIRRSKIPFSLLSDLNFVHSFSLDAVYQTFLP